jgi:hypothetical protein
MKDDLNAETVPQGQNQSAKRSEERVKQALENARQAVKPIVKQEMEGELVSNELLSVRLRGLR